MEHRKRRHQTWSCSEDWQLKAFCIWIGPFGPTSKFNAFLVRRSIIFCLTWDRKRSVSDIIICHEDIIWWCVLWTPRSSRGLGQVGQLALDLVGGALGGQHFTSMKVVSWRSISRIQDDPGTNKIKSYESWTYSDVFRISLDFIVDPRGSLSTSL